MRVILKFQGPIHPENGDDAATAMMSVCVPLGAGHSNRTPCKSQC